MDATIHPSFARDSLPSNALELCDLLRLSNESEVPIESFTIISDGNKMVTKVGPGTYKTALVLVYLSALAGFPAFVLTNAMHEHILSPYFGLTLLADAANPQTKRTNLRALVGKTVRIKVKFRPDYDHANLPKSRTVQDILWFGWERRESLTATSPEPFLRAAIAWLLNRADHHLLDPDEIIGSLTMTQWVNRARNMYCRLTPNQTGS